MQNMMRWALLMGLLFSFVPHTQGQDFVQPQDTTRVAWHPDGRYLAVMSETQLDIVDTRNGVIVNTFSGIDANAVFAKPAWSPDGSQIAFANSNRIEIWSTPWNPEQAQFVTELKKFDTGAYAGNVSWVDDRIAISSSNHLLVFETEDFSPILEVPPTHSMSDLQLRPDGEWLAVSRILDALEIWDVNTGEIQWAFYLKSYLDPRQDYINPSPYGIAWSPDGKQMAFGATDGLRIIDFDTLISDYPEISLSHNKSVIFLEQNYSAYDRVLAVDWNPIQNLIASGDENGQVKIWNVDTQELIETIQLGEDVRIFSVAWSPDGTQLAYGLLPGGTGPAVAIVPSPVQPPPSIIAFSLIDNIASAVVGPLNESDTLDLSTLPASVAVQADTVGAIGSVIFNLDGGVTSDDEAPFTVPLDTTLGARTLTATPYSGPDGTGDAGTPLTVTFTMVGRSERGS